MTRYLLYINNINTMEEERLPKIGSNSSQNYKWLKLGWHKNANSWLNHGGIKEEITLEILLHLNLMRNCGVIKN